MGGVALAAWIAALGAAGVGALQLREKDLSDRDLWALARRARALLPPPALLLVNGRADVALAAGADGVHLPADGVPVAPLVRRFGGRLRIGRSTHRLEEVEQARRDGAGWVTFGPVFATPGKGPPVGLPGLAAAVATGIPVYALGGITLDRLGEVAATGAMGAAGIRLFQDATRLAETVAAARAAFAGSRALHHGPAGPEEGSRP